MTLFGKRRQAVCGTSSIITEVRATAVLRLYVALFCDHPSAPCSRVSTVCQIQFRSFGNFVRSLEQKLLLSGTAVTLNQGQGQLDKYKNVEFHNIYHHTKFKPKHSINVRRYANVF